MAVAISGMDNLSGAPTDAAIIPVVQSGLNYKSTFANLISGLTVAVPSTLTAFIPLNSGNLNEHLFGSYSVLALNQALNSGAPINLTGGVGHIGFSVDAGMDVSGEIVISGTSVTHANTGDETAADTETIPVDSLSINTSDVDAAGNLRVGLENGYLSSKLWKGAITVSTTNLNLSNIDVFQLFTDHVQPGGTIVDFEIIAKASNTNAWFYGYLYGLTRDTAAKKLDIERVVSFALPASDVNANNYYTNFASNIGFTYNEAHGFFTQLFFGPSGQTYWSEINARLELSNTISVINV